MGNKGKTSPPLKFSRRTLCGVNPLSGKSRSRFSTGQTKSRKKRFESKSNKMNCREYAKKEGKEGDNIFVPQGKIFTSIDTNQGRDNIVGVVCGTWSDFPLFARFLIFP